MAEKKIWYIQRHSNLDAKTGTFIDTELHKGCVKVKECKSLPAAKKALKAAQTP